MEKQEFTKESIKTSRSKFQDKTTKEGVSGTRGPGPCPKGVRLSDGIVPEFGTMYADNIQTNMNEIVDHIDYKYELDNSDINILYKEKSVGNPIDIIVKENSIHFGPSAYNNPYGTETTVISETSISKKIKNGLSDLQNIKEDKETVELLKIKTKILRMLKINTNEDRNQCVIDKNKKDPVLQDWVMNLNWKMQTGLISSIRGYDNDIEVEDNTDVVDIKSVVKMIRFLVLRNADSNTRFMSKYCLPEDAVVDILVNHVEQSIKNYTSLHWVKHIIMAIDIIMNYHHSSYVQHYWLNVSKKFNTELNEMLTYRIV